MLKHYADFDFSRSGYSFGDRIGSPTEADAALGRVCLSFSFLDDTVRGLIQVFMGGDSRVARILTTELSFRQTVETLGAVARERIDTVVSDDDRGVAREVLDEVLYLCRRSEEMRNTYLHSSYDGDRRVKTTAKAKTGLRVVAEITDAALLLDVADFIEGTAWICGELPINVGFADNYHSDGRTTKYSRGGELIGSFTLPASASHA